MLLLSSFSRCSSGFCEHSVGTSVRQKIGFEKVLKMGVSVSRFLAAGIVWDNFVARQDFTSIGPLGRERKFSPKFYWPKFLEIPEGRGRPRLRVTDIRAQILVFPGFWAPWPKFLAGIWPPRCPRDIRPKNFLFGLIFRSWKTLRRGSEMLVFFFSWGRKRWKTNGEKMVAFWVPIFSRSTQSFSRFIRDANGEKTSRYWYELFHG